MITWFIPRRLSTHGESLHERPKGRLPAGISHMTLSLRLGRTRNKEGRNVIFEEICEVTSEELTKIIAVINCAKD